MTSSNIVVEYQLRRVTQIALTERGELGRTRSARMAERVPEGTKRQARMQAVLGRTASVEDIAEQVLASCRTETVTGQVLVVDGGMPAGNPQNSSNLGQGVSRRSLQTLNSGTRWSTSAPRRNRPPL